MGKFRVDSINIANIKNEALKTVAVKANKNNDDKLEGNEISIFENKAEKLIKLGVATPEELKALGYKTDKEIRIDKKIEKESKQAQENELNYNVDNDKTTIENVGDKVSFSTVLKGVPEKDIKVVKDILANTKYHSLADIRKNHHEIVKEIRKGKEKFK